VFCKKRGRLVYQGCGRLCHRYIWNYNTQDVVKQFEITDLPVRAAKFVVRKQWVVAGSDDMCVPVSLLRPESPVSMRLNLMSLSRHCTVMNYNTMEKVKRFEAHSDYIRSIAVHPSLSILLTSSDDMLVRQNLRTL
jgi:coatomer subunit beta'